MVGTVVENKALLWIPGAEVGPQQGENPVFWLDLPRQHPVKLREAGKALIHVGLVLQMPHRLAHPVHRGVGEVSSDFRSLVVGQTEKPPQPQLPVGQAGEEGPHRQPRPLPPEPGKGAVHPHGVLLIGGHRPQGVEGTAHVPRGVELHRLLPVDIAVEHAG